VISDARERSSVPLPASLGLNAPFGARCFLTDYWTFNDPTVIKSICTFWRSVLSDVLLKNNRNSADERVLMHRLALGAF